MSDANIRIAIEKAEKALAEVDAIYYAYCTCGTRLADAQAAREASTAGDAIMRLIEHLQQKPH